MTAQPRPTAAIASATGDWLLPDEPENTASPVGGVLAVRVDEIAIEPRMHESRGRRVDYFNPDFGRGRLTGGSSGRARRALGGL
jgi:hypothetical protein